MARRPVRLRGITWLETLFAILIMGLTASAFAALLQSSAKAQSMAGTYQQAASLAQHKIDQLRTVGYGRLTYSELRAAGIVDGTSQASPYPFTATDSLASIHPTCVGTISVSDYSTGIRQVTVRLVWTTDASRRTDGDVTINALVVKS